MSVELHKVDPIHALVRIASWSAWLPETDDKNHPQMQITNGTTSIPIAEGERIITIEHMDTGIPFKAIGENKEEQIFTLNVFKATIVRALPKDLDVDNFIDPQPPEAEARKTIKEYHNQQSARARIASVPSRRGRPGANSD